MNKTLLYDSCHQQEDDNDILLQLLKAKISIDKSTGIRTIDCDKDVFRQVDGCVIARDGDRLHMCLTMGEEVEVPDGVRSVVLSAIHHELCPNVRHVIFPQSIEAISGYAIISETVEEVTIHNAGAYISDDAFSWCTSLRAIHYPSQNKTIYLERKPKRGLVYEKQIFPKHCYGECVTAPETESRIVYSFDKVTLAKGQVFRIYFYEDGGPRNFVLSFGMKDLSK